ncbi:MAG: hypothetical protein ACPLKQ_07040 [Candidatus Bathyarchaeales archaeon]
MEYNHEKPIPARKAKINVAIGRNVLPGALNGIGIIVYKAIDSDVEKSIKRTPKRKGAMYLLFLKIAKMLRVIGKN